MTSNRTLQLLLAVLAAIGFSATAQAQATRTWVSGTGDDANPCSRTAPCKTFAGAIGKTSEGGEIDAIDAGGYGAVTITKSITIDGAGTNASILNAGTNGVNINITSGTSTKTVTLRNLSIQGANTGFVGVNIISAANVNIIDCVILNQRGNGANSHGILVNAPSTTNLMVKNTAIKNCSGDGLNVTAPGGSFAKVALSNVTIAECANGIHALNNSRVSAQNCTISGNTNAGVFSEGISGVAVTNIASSEVSNNGVSGVQAGGGSSATLSVVRITNCQIHQNGGSGALVATNGEVDTWQDNRITGNGTDGCPGCTLHNGD